MSTAGYNKPIKLEDFKLAIHDMTVSELNQVKHEIQNSRRHLVTSNSFLEKYIMTLKGEKDEIEGEKLEELDEDDIKLFEDSIRDNEHILENYDARLAAVDEEVMLQTTGMDSKNHSAAHTTKEAEEPEKTSHIPNTIYL